MTSTIATFNPPLLAFRTPGQDERGNNRDGWNTSVYAIKVLETSSGGHTAFLITDGERFVWAPMDRIAMED